MARSICSCCGLACSLSSAMLPPVDAIRAPGWPQGAHSDYSTGLLGGHEPPLLVGIARSRCLHARIAEDDGEVRHRALDNLQRLAVIPKHVDFGRPRAVDL